MKVSPACIGVFYIPQTVILKHHKMPTKSGHFLLADSTYIFHLTNSIWFYLCLINN